MTNYQTEVGWDERILILAPTGRDAAMTARFMESAHLHPLICKGYKELSAAMRDGCGLLFLTSEALTAQVLAVVLEVLQEQPPWSDLPLLVLISGGNTAPSNSASLDELVKAGNVTLIERPARVSTLVSALSSALRARRRQYEVRDHLASEVRAQEALRESEERLRVALNAAQLGAWEVDLATNQVTCTPICRGNFGLPTDAEINYETLFDLIHAEDREAVRSAMDEAVRTKDGFRVEYRVTWPDGREHWILTSGRASQDGSGEAHRLVGVTLDITERKQVEVDREALLRRERAARAEAEASSRLKDEFLATVSHELRTPLTAILGWADLLRSGELSEAVAARGLETIERNARSQVQLINDLLDVSRIISGNLRIELKPLNLEGVVESAMNVVRPLAAAKNIRLEARLGNGFPFVAGDSERLQQIVQNLLGNAVKFTAKNGLVEVDLKRDGARLHLSVKDNGQGIPPEFLPHVFDRFRQADQSTTRSHGGLGLGLAIVRQLVELHGGTVDARSPGRGGGSTFTVRLPALIDDTVSGDNGSREVEAPAQAPLPLNSVDVLVVDDEPDTREILCAILSLGGAQVRGVPSASAAMDMLREWRPDVLVSDIGMPDEDGYSLIRRVRALDQARDRVVPALALTAYAKSEDRIRLLESGFQMHVPKPVHPADLIAAVANLAKEHFSIANGHAAG